MKKLIVSMLALMLAFTTTCGAVTLPTLLCAAFESVQDIVDALPEPESPWYVTTDESKDNLGNACTVYNFLTRRWDAVYDRLGCTTERLKLGPVTATAIISNMFIECSVKPNTGNRVYGLLQWAGGRRTKLINFCKNNGLNYRTLEGQLMFLVWEAQESGEYKNYRAWVNAFPADTSYTQENVAAAARMYRAKIERCAASGRNLANKMVYGWFNKCQGGAAFKAAYPSLFHYIEKYKETNVVAGWR